MERVLNGSRSEDHNEPGDNEGILVAKIVAMVVLSLATFLLGMLPSKLWTWFKWDTPSDSSEGSPSRSRNVLSLLLCFGGGALLCTTFLHMLPELRESIEALQEKGKIGKTDFHLPELIMCCGFFTMYLVEELVHLYLHWREDSRGLSRDSKAIRRSFSVRQCPDNTEQVPKVSDDSGQYSSTSTVSTLDVPQRDNVTVTFPPPMKKVSSHHSHSHVPVSSDEDPIVTSVRGLLIVLALSIHELFEGLAVGLQTSTGFVWYMLGAVSSHKLVIAFCVGIELVSSRTKPILILVYISTFALVSPLGIGIGLGITEEDSEVQGGVPNSVLQGLATGTLLYVVFFEVLQRERGKHDLGLLQLLAIMLGFGTMFGLLLAVGHDDAHDH